MISTPRSKLALAAIVLPSCLFFSLHVASAQGTKADYERASTLANSTRDKVFKARVEPHWFEHGDMFWYRNDLADNAREFIVVDAVKGKRERGFDHEKLAKKLSEATKSDVKADRLPIERLEVDKEGAVVFFALDKGWKYVPKDDSLEEHEAPKGSTEPSQAPQTGRGGARGGSRRPAAPSADSPDGKLSAFVKNHNVYLREKSGGKEYQLSFEGMESDRYSGEFYWSPDSTRLVAARRFKGDERKVVEVESSPKDQLQPKHLEFNYLKPGDRVPYSKPHLFNAIDRIEIPIRDDLFSNPWDVEDTLWSKDSSYFTFVYNQRGHQTLRLISVDAKTGYAKAIVDEQSKTFIDYAQKGYRHFVKDKNEVLWMSERDGWNHLYLIDMNSGGIKAQVTKGEWVVRQVDRVDEEKRQVWFRAGGIKAGQDPYQIHFARVDFDGNNLVVFTDGDGTHEVRFSPDERFLIDSYSRVDLAPVTELRKTADGSLVVELERADWSKLLETGWKVPERFVAKGRDGATDIYGVIFRPTQFDDKAKYPVIEQIYAGPQGAFVPKRFAPFHGPQGMAELGFVVVQIDGMGTNWRSKAFHDVCWKNLGDAGFPDRILWLKEAAKKYPAFDLSRLGVYGGSAGGQNALGALLFHGDFYKAAAADCGCHDNRMDKVWWNELWMGWPLGPHYAEQSNVTQAHRLQGKLLLTVGELDHNVDPSSTMQVVNALIAADKDFELIVFPGRDHGAGSSPYGRRRMRDFFVKNLLGVEPRSK